MEGMSPVEPFSKMLIRQRFERETKQSLEKQYQKEAQTKGIRFKKDKEFGELDPVHQQALDKDAGKVLSTSPLKYRVQLDIYGSPNKSQDAIEGGPKSGRRSRGSKITPSNNVSNVSYRQAPNLLENRSTASFHSPAKYGARIQMSTSSSAKNPFRQNQNPL